ncbi:MAG: nitroreductase/quinone reductase family protein [Dehalococcoidia bacterium]|jgi:deazaflavin-dependent oxidoreductase (nitroreductase family)|nr:nitroreductase/quinone reductase family protein [Dehalococcoidia bacterium]
MDEAARKALTEDRLIDITTTGRKSGEARRIEIWFHNVDGAIYITGRPGKRSWYSNMLASPDFTLHLKESAQADLAARATAVRDDARRREVLSQVVAKLDGDQDLDDWMARSPLVKVEFVD